MLVAWLGTADLRAPDLGDEADVGPMDLFTITNSPTPPTTYCAPGRKRISLICYLRLQRRINFDDPASEEDR
jgi:hypothetical protein